MKQRWGSIHRIEASGRSAICQGMFKKESDISAFAGMKVQTAFPPPDTAHLTKCMLLSHPPCARRSSVPLPLLACRCSKAYGGTGHARSLWRPCYWESNMSQSRR